MRGIPGIVNGGPSNAITPTTPGVKFAIAPNINAGSDGDATTFSPDINANANATHIPQNFYNDTIANITLTGRQGNGEQGPNSDDTQDDHLQLSRAVNTAANVLTGTATFVQSGLLITAAPPVDLRVELSSGLFCLEGEKHHASDDQLVNIPIEIDGVEAGNGNIWIMLPSRDHYVAIQPTSSFFGYDGTEYLAPQLRIHLQVSSVPLNDPAPASIPGHFFFSKVVTNATDIVSVTYLARGTTIDAGAATQQGTFRFRPKFPDGSAFVAFEPLWNGMHDLGSEVSPESQDFGYHWATVYHSQSRRRASATAKNRWVHRTNSFSVVPAGAGTTTVPAPDLDMTAFPNGTSMTIIAVANVYATDDTGTMVTARAQVLKDSGGTVVMLHNPAAVAHVGFDAAPYNVAMLSIVLSGSDVVMDLTEVAVVSTNWVVDLTYIANGPTT